MLVAVILLVTSCKKQQDTQQEQIDPKQQKEIHSYQNGNEVKTINLNEFRAKVDLKTLGTLQQAFEKPKFSKEGTMLLNTEQTYEGFALQTDSIKMLIANGHTSYIFLVKLSSPRAVTFQNLTIDQSTEGTKIFVNTYTPTQQWIADWRAGKAGKFDGEISVSYLSGSVSPLSVNSSIDLTGANGKLANTAKPNKLGLVDANGCSTTTYYFNLPYNCASGQHGPSDPGCYLTGSDRAGVATISFDITTCTETGGGGGGTTPTPPGDYDPCGSGGTPPTVSYNGARGAKLMVHENPDCNPTVPPVLPEPPKEIKDSVQNPCIKTQLSLALNAKTTIREMLNNTFAGIIRFEDLDLIFRDPTNLANNIDGEMQRLSGIEYEIRLNRNSLTNSSKEYIVSTIYHEILHAYLESKLVKGSDGRYIITDQHQDMATKYVTLMTGALRIAFPSLDSNEAWALSWGGLEQTPFYATKLTNDQRKAITTLNDKHKNKGAADRLGSYCN